MGGRWAGGLPCSPSEEEILALAASIAAGVPVALGDLIRAGRRKGLRIELPAPKKACSNRTPTVKEQCDVQSTGSGT